MQTQILSISSENTYIHTQTHKTDRQLKQKGNFNVYSLTFNKNLSAYVLFLHIKFNYFKFQIYYK